VVTGPTLDFHTDNNLGLAVALDGGQPQVQYVFTPETRKEQTFLGKAFQENAENNVRTMHFTVTADQAGRNTLKLIMVDPAIIVQKIIIHDADLPHSYFGPPDSARNGLAGTRH